MTYSCDTCRVVYAERPADGCCRLAHFMTPGDRQPANGTPYQCTGTINEVVSL